MNTSVAVSAVIGVMVVGVLLSFLLSWPIMWLWNNSLVGAIVGVNEVSWLQAWGIAILSGLLFKTTVSTKN